MLTIYILLILLSSNAVQGRDKSIVFARLSITVLICCFLLCVTSSYSQFNAKALLSNYGYNFNAPLIVFGLAAVVFVLLIAVKLHEKGWKIKFDAFISFLRQCIILALAGFCLKWLVIKGLIDFDCLVLIYIYSGLVAIPLRIMYLSLINETLDLKFEDYVWSFFWGAATAMFIYGLGINVWIAFTSCLDLVKNSAENKGRALAELAEFFTSGPNQAKLAQTGSTASTNLPSKNSGGPLYMDQNPPVNQDNGLIYDPARNSYVPRPVVPGPVVGTAVRFEGILTLEETKLRTGGRWSSLAVEDYKPELMTPANRNNLADKIQEKVGIFKSKPGNANIEPQFKQLYLHRDQTNRQTFFTIMIHINPGISGHIYITSDINHTIVTPGVINSIRTWPH